MAVDEATKRKNALELFQIDEEAIMPFFENHLDELCRFIQERAENHLSLLELLKQFVRSAQQPFNMQRYMAVQSTYIRESLQEKILDRQQAVSRWIQENAGKHRSRMIQLQCLYLERIKDQVLPKVEDLLSRRIENLRSKLG
ncbi:MAG: hypothetical protein MJY87_00275 [Fibrobacter sp.]|nr:hypothetical protein [Fibrobacter sp.]